MLRKTLEALLDAAAILLFVPMLLLVYAGRDQRQSGGRTRAGT